MRRSGLSALAATLVLGTSASARAIPTWSGELDGPLGPDVPPECSKIEGTEPVRKVVPQDGMTPPCS